MINPEQYQPFFPILWAIISSIIALILYRFGTATFGDKDNLVVTGAVLIAILFFNLMAKNTHFTPPGTQPIRTDDLSHVVELALSNQNSAMELNACTRVVNDILSCRTEIEAHQLDAERLSTAIQALQKK